MERAAGTGTGSSMLQNIVWPSRILQPSRPPALIHLDLNHFIYLARAAAGDATVPAGYGALLEASRRARGDGRAIFPLSATHYVEMSGIRDAKQRTSIADIMEELSGFSVLLGRVTIAELEIDAMLDVLFSSVASGGVIPLLGTSVGWEFGMRRGLVIRDAVGNDTSAQKRTLMGAPEFEDFFTHANRAMERALLAGPADEDLPALRANGYAPELTYHATETRAQQERAQAARLDADPRRRRGRLRDVVGARELAVEWIDQFTRALMARDTTIGQTIQDKRNGIRAFADCIPSSHVAITLKTRYQRDGQHQWTPNDIHDIDALAVAVPYCDAVFTDKAVRNALTASREVLPFGTYLPRRPSDLTDWINALAA